MGYNLKKSFNFQWLLGSSDVSVSVRRDPKIIYRDRSPIYEFPNANIPLNSDLNPGDSYYLELDRVKPYSKYTPFNWVRIQNLSDANILVKFNGQQPVPVSNNTNTSLDDETIPAIRTIEVINVDPINIVYADQIKINIQKQITYKDDIRTIAGRGKL